MSSEIRTPHGPPWDVDDVADVHAGVFPADVTAELLGRIRSDPDGAAVLAALDSTVDDLSLLPPLLMPPQYVLRMDAALYAERRRVDATRPIVRERLGALIAPGAPGVRPIDRPAPHLPTPRPQPRSGPPMPRVGAPAPTVPPRHQPVIPAVLPGAPPASAPAPVADLAAARARAAERPDTRQNSAPRAGSRIGSLEAQRRKRRRWTSGLLAAAAVAGIGTIAIVALNQPSSSGVAQDGGGVPTSVVAPGAGNPSGSALKLDLGNLGSAVSQIEGTTPRGVLSDLPRYASCLKLNSISADDVTGATEVTYDGQEAVAIVVKDAADAGKVRVVVVGTSCGTGDDAATLTDQTVDR